MLTKELDFFLVTDRVSRGKSPSARSIFWWMFNLSFDVVHGLNLASASWKGGEK